MIVKNNNNIIKSVNRKLIGKIILLLQNIGDFEFI